MFVMISKIVITRTLVFITLIGAQLVFLGCGQGRGFALPEGDIEAGKAVFTKFNCNDCHSIGAIEFAGTEDNLHVPLGGEVSKLKTYGELVTSVINPSHKVAGRYKASLNPNNQMKTYNEVMTVQELVDIVTFLQSEYDIVAPETYYYPY
jgi:mono/diheme cytochrome c family protein